MQGSRTFLLPACGCFLLTFPDARAFSRDGRDVGVVGEPVEKRRDTGGVGKDEVPFLEGPVGGDDDGFSLITPIDDLVEQVRGMMIVGEISYFVDAEQRRAAVQSSRNASRA